MEHASKALLIAGAILLSILLISLGVFLYNKASTTSQTTSDFVDEQRIMRYNTDLERYEGRQDGASVKSALQIVIQLAKESKAENDCVGVYCSSSDILNKIDDGYIVSVLQGSRWYGVRLVPNLQTIKNAVNKNTYYTISYEYRSKGLLWKMHIDPDK